MKTRGAAGSTRRATALKACFLLWIGVASLACGDAATPPNILLIIADDQGFRDCGFMGSDVVQAPNIDRLAAEGTVFPLGYPTSSLCKPTLMTLLTGLHPYQWNEILDRQGTPMWAPPGELALFSLSRRLHAEHRLIRRLSTLPRLVAESGYATFDRGRPFPLTPPCLTIPILGRCARTLLLWPIPLVALFVVDPVYQKVVVGAAVWYALGIGWFAAVGRHGLVYSPEERFAVGARRQGPGAPRSR
jgi:hypothetical protein